MAKINMLVLERENNIRTQSEFSNERDLMKYLFENNKNSMIVRFDPIDSMLSKKNKDRLFGPSVSKVLNNIPNKEIYNFATSKNAGFTLLGLISTYYTHSNDDKQRAEWSDKIDKVLEIIDKTSALLEHNVSEDSIITETLTEIKSNFSVYKADADTVNPAVKKISTGGIPDMTIVLCTTKARKDFDIKSMKEALHNILIKSTLNMNDVRKKINIDGFDKELAIIAHATDEMYNITELNINSSLKEIEKSTKSFIEMMEAEKNSILEVLYIFNAIAKAEKTEIFASKEAKKSFGGIANIADLIKLISTI